MHVVTLLVCVSILAGCARTSASTPTVLPAPAGTKSEVATQLERGNALFGSRDWAAAEQAFRQTIAADGGLAEAHYNLAVTLDRMGNQLEAKKHYIEAANLAPGNKVIWNSPPLRTHTGDLGHNVGKNSYQDPSYKGF